MTPAGAGPVTVRTAGTADVGDIARVHLDAVVTGYAGIFPAGAPAPTLGQLEREWEEALAESRSVSLVAVDAGRLVGVVVARPDPEYAGCGQLRRLNVAPDVWGRGVGDRLHDEALSRLGQAGFAEAGLWVLEGNQRARAMYERRGWDLVPGVTKDWTGLGVIEVRYRHLLA